MQETLAYQLSQGTSGSDTSTTATSTSDSSASNEAKLMMQIMKLAQSYGIGQDNSSTVFSSLLATA
jgi:hypothetical protein